MREIKRRQIVNTAIDLFAEHGIAKTSISRIAKKFGATKGMVYHYFPNGKSEIINNILQDLEDSVSENTPSRSDWESKDANVKSILSSLFFKFPSKDILRMRKITRIIMAEMFFNEQIANHAAMRLLAGREAMLADCFTALANNGKIAPLDAESTARCLNRLIVTYAIEDAMRFPFQQNDDELESGTKRMFEDCENIIGHMILSVLFTDILPRFDYPINNEQITLSRHILNSVSIKLVTTTKIGTDTDRALAYLVPTVIAKLGRLKIHP